MKLKGKVVAITGAAQGLGQALAQRCSEEGAQVVVGDMNPVSYTHLRSGPGTRIWTRSSA